MPEDTNRHRAAWLRVAALVLILAVSALLVATSGPDITSARDTLQRLGWLAPVAGAALYAVLTVLMAPGAFLTAGVGVLFGTATGIVVALLGAIVGATVAFVIARHSTRTAVDRLLTGRGRAVDAWLSERGLIAVLTLRLVPLVPFSAANYAAGLTGISRRDYLIGTALGIVPGTVAYVAIGANITRPGDPQFIAAIVGLGALSVLGAVVLRRRTRD
ncbi:MAG: TVP38/TMEM64 family protein [Actinobacteria bacterium]|nr:TVP38/TMEM64 family protein [Actinomycetota bacterium]